MQDRLVQVVRYKLQKRVRRLGSADFQHFPAALRLFLKFVDGTPSLAGVRDELVARTAALGIPASAERVVGGDQLFGESEEESAALGYALLRLSAVDPERVDLVAIGSNYGRGRKANECLDTARELFLEPFYEYLDEHLDDQQAILAVLRRYKHRCEWFHADRLRQQAADDSQRGEKGLAFDLYEYLHGEGIEFHVEPRSASGIADLVADQVGDDRVVADAKLFWPEKGKGKAYLISGFHQAYTYARDFNEACAYLVIYKMTREDVTFLVPKTQAMFPSLTVNNKTVFFVVVDLCDHGVPASKRGPLKGVEVTDGNLSGRLRHGRPSQEHRRWTATHFVPAPPERVRSGI